MSNTKSKSDLERCDLMSEWERLRVEVRESGALKRAYGRYLLWGGSIFALYGITYYCILSDLWRLPAILVAAFAHVQLGLIAHEAGHGAVSPRRGLSHLIGHLADTVLVGFSFSYWLSTHKPHHVFPNQAGVDPDLDFATFSVTREDAVTKRGFGRWFTRNQRLLMAPGFLLWAFSIKFDGAKFVLKHGTRAHVIDAIGLLAHVTLWIVVPLAIGQPGAIGAYVLINMLMGIYMAGIFVVNHIGTGVMQRDEERPFPERQIFFSRNFNTSWASTLLCAGLNLQIEHHLFPSAPSFQLKRAQPLIVDFCRRHNLKYRQMSYLAAWREVLEHLKEMERAARSSGAAQLDRATGGVERAVDLAAAADDDPRLVDHLDIAADPPDRPGLDVPRRVSRLSGPGGRSGARPTTVPELALAAGPIDFTQGSPPSKMRNSPDRRKPYSPRRGS